VVRRTFAPWWRKVQPLAVLGGEFRRREPVAPTPPPRKRRRAEKAGKGSVTAGIATFVLAVPDMLGQGLLFVLSLPFAAVELVALGVAGGVLHVLRTLRLVRHRVDILGVDGRKLHSLTALLVRGSRRDANALVQGIAATIAESDRAYVPEKLPPGVTVVSQEGFWD